MAGSRSIRAGSAFVELFTDAANFDKGLEKAKQRLNTFADSVKGIGQSMMAASALALSPFAAGSKEFSAFETNMANIATVLSEPEKHLGTFKAGVKDMAVQFGE